MRYQCFIIVLAWPEGMTASVNKWYDKFFATNGKYRVGHSALVFVDAQKKDIYVSRAYSSLSDGVYIPLFARLKCVKVLRDWILFFI